MGRQETLWPLNTGLRSNRATGGKATNKVAAHCRSRVTASHVPGESGHFLKASLTFSPACFRLPFTSSALPSPSMYGSSRALPASFLTLPLAAWALSFALSAALTAVPSSRHTVGHARRCPRKIVPNIWNCPAEKDQAHRPRDLHHRARAMGTSVLEGDLQQRDELGCAGQPGIAPGCSLGAFPEASSWFSSSICARTALIRCL